MPPFLACFVHPSMEHNRRAFLIGDVVLALTSTVDFLLLLLGTGIFWKIRMFFGI